MNQDGFESVRRPYDESIQRNIVARQHRYAGKTMSNASNPCITAREAIALADWVAAQEQEIARLKQQLEECGAGQYVLGEEKAVLTCEVESLKQHLAEREKDEDFWKQYDDCVKAYASELGSRNKELDICRQQLHVERARNDRLIKVLSSIHMRIYPKFTTLPDGKTFRFIAPNPHDYLQALGDAIRQITDEVAYVAPTNPQGGDGDEV